MLNNIEENKVVLICESGEGKTCIIEQFITNDFTENQDSTIAAQFCRKDLEFPRGEKISLVIWDKAEQEKFKVLTRIFIKTLKQLLLFIVLLIRYHLKK